MLDMRQGQCPLCQHDEIIEATLSEFSGEYDERERPLAIAHGTRYQFIVGERTDPDRSYGVLSQCICRRGGFVQWFAADPGKIARIGESRLPVRAGDWLAFPIGRVSEGSCGS